MTEWELQARLEKVWPLTGVRLVEETLLLVGREVMTDWEQNDYRVAWNKPSIDFLALDSRGRLVAIELKNRLDTRQQVLTAAVQVTSMALALASSVSWQRLEQTHARLLDGRLKGDLASAWTSAFGTPPPTEVAFTPVRRLLVARSVRVPGPTGQELAQATPADLVSLAASLNGGRLAKRLRAWLGQSTSLLPLEYLAVRDMSEETAR